MKATRLRITSLKFISAVDAGAQGPIANVALVKRAPAGNQYQLTANVAKLDDALGVVFGYAVASTVDGGNSPHIDLQGDAVLGGDELIKVALGFAEAGAESDVMHDCVKDGWVPFVMPLNAETKKAFKLAGDVEGIAIGMKPSAETFKRFQTGELAAFSIYGEGIRTPLDDEQKKRAPDKIAKAHLATDEVDGHAHVILIYEDGSLYVQHATSAGAGYSHSHGIMRGADGSLTILADSGHTHALADGQAGVVVVPADAVVVVQASAPKPRVLVENDARPVIASMSDASKSTRSTGIQHGGLTKAKDQAMPTEQDTKISDLEKQVARLSKVAKLSGAQKSHFDTLNADDAEAFLAKSNTERDALVADVAKRADETNVIVYTSKSTSDVYRAKDDARLVEMAKRMDAQADEIEKADVRKAAAETLGNLTGSNEVHDLIVRSLKKSGAKAEDIGAALQAMKGWNTLAAQAGVAKGANVGTDPVALDSTQAFVALEKGLEAFAKANNITKNVWTEGLAKFVKTDEGKALKAAHDASRAV